MAKLVYFVFLIVFISCHIKSPDALKRFNCECGRASVEPLHMRIVGGKSAVPHSMPWLVAILFNGHMFCGGTLLTDRHVLTAGHCVDGLDKRNFVVILGLDHVDDLRNVVYRRIKKFVLHYNFTSTLVRDDNDIGVITLDRTVSFNSKIRPICLPKPGKEFTDYMGVIAGWGKLGPANRMSKKLLKANLKIISKDQCAVDAMIAASLTANMICGYYQGRDGCQGDSGGPLMIIEENSGRYVQAGIVSWGVSCGDPRYPGVYTKVSLYNNWINKLIADGMTCKN